MSGTWATVTNKTDKNPSCCKIYTLIEGEHLGHTPGVCGEWQGGLGGWAAGVYEGRGIRRWHGAPDHEGPLDTVRSLAPWRGLLKCLLGPSFAIPSTTSLFHALVRSSLYGLSSFLVGLSASSFFLYFIRYIAARLILLKILIYSVLMPAVSKELLGNRDMAKIGEIYSMLSYH